MGRELPVRRRPGHGSPLTPGSGRYHLCRTSLLGWARPEAAGSTCGRVTGSNSEPRRAVAWAPGPGADRAGRGRTRRGVGGVGGRARGSLRSGSARTACPGHGKGGDASRGDGRTAVHKHPPTTPTMPPSVRLWAEAFVSDNAVPAGTRRSPLRCAYGPSGSHWRLCRRGTLLPGGACLGRHDAPRITWLSLRGRQWSKQVDRPAVGKGEIGSMPASRWG